MVTAGPTAPVVTMTDDPFSLLCRATASRHGIPSPVTDGYQVTTRPFYQPFRGLSSVLTVLTDEGR